ncbi:roadblock/LC7 domain-containing protein [Actinokineospora soli]|uniref:Roadblock/LC7 domain-containing protein n=1 Tax=Actinokineospora soli TaxID=1048753 RepID=A0ABW2TRI7_9PSEU
MTETSTTRSRLDWLVDDLVDRIAGASHAVLLSADGLLLARTAGIAQADAEHLAAVGSAYRSLSHGAGRHFGLGVVHQTVVEFGQAYLVVTEAGDGACLAVLTRDDADLGLVGYEVNRVVAQVRPHLASPPRAVPGVARAS